MKTLTATEAARKFADLLDSIERRGESYLITRHGRPIARVVPTVKGTGKALKEILERHKPDKDWWREIKETRALLTLDVEEWRD
ncbi:MAG: type II toxin-antitoxin system Phd/YefM family antitoxin [Chloroflexi bacterium]|nr:type II toxin-antitoxin system Phd/YefM family antitoxin [Chloroflexota bacterium]